MRLRMGWGIVVGLMLSVAMPLQAQQKNGPATNKSNAKNNSGKPAVKAAAEPTKPVATKSEAAKSDVAKKPAAVKPAIADPEVPEGKYLLRYKLKPGQMIQSEVTHLAKTDTKIEKAEQSSQSRTVSQKIWQVESVASNGDMTFVYSIESVDMSQQIGTGPETTYNSKADEEAPSIFGRVKDSIGKPLSKVTIDRLGQVVNREEGKATPNMGMGDLAMIMPEKPIGIGDQWEAPREIRVRTQDGGQKTIKIRELHELEKVSAGVATISIRSEPLTPITEPEIEAQVVQQLSNGSLRFDLDAGHLMAKDLKWNEKIVGFSGPGSMMEYTARYTEEVKHVEMKGIATATKPSSENSKNKR